MRFLHSEFADGDRPSYNSRRFRICRADGPRGKAANILCRTAHSSDLAEGELNFESLPRLDRPTGRRYPNATPLGRWSHDRIQRQEMPPADATSNDSELQDDVRDEFPGHSSPRS